MKRNLNNIAAMDARTLQRRVAWIGQIFSDGTVKPAHIVVGKHCLVFSSNIAEEVRAAAAEKFKATDMFKCDCNRCRPHIDEGSYILVGPRGVMAVRLQCLASRGGIEYVRFSRESIPGYLLTAAESSVVPFSNRSAQ